MAKDFTFPFMYKEWLVSTAEWSADLRGWYINLLCHQADKGMIPEDLESIATLAGVKFSEYTRFTSCWKRMLSKKFSVRLEQNDENGLANPVLKRLLDSRNNYKERQSRRGIVGVLIKQAKKDHPKFNEDDEFWARVSKKLIEDDELFTLTKSARSIRLKHTLEAFIDNVNDNDNSNENKNKKGKKFTKADFRKKILSFGTDPKHVEDWLTAREKKRLVYTESALDLFLNECEKHNYPIPEAVKQCAQRGWGGFKYEWLQNTQNGQPGNTKPRTDNEIKQMASSGVDNLLGKTGPGGAD